MYIIHNRHNGKNIYQCACGSLRRKTRGTFILTKTNTIQSLTFYVDLRYKRNTQ